MDFSGRVVVITGGGSGIGQACAREFADRHAAVALVDRDAKAGEQTDPNCEARTNVPSSSRLIRVFAPRLNPSFQKSRRDSGASMFW